MIVQKEFLNKLKDFGLNSYESKLWTALLSRGVSTAGELSDIANVPRSRSYDVLESLEKKGFIVLKLGKPIKYVAVAPEDVLERVKKQVVNETESQIKVLDDLKQSDVLKELRLLHSQGIELVEPTDLSGSLKGRSNSYHHIDSLIKSANDSIVLATTAQGLLRKKTQFMSSLQKAHKRGVKIKIAVPITKQVEKVVKEFSTIADVRHYDKAKGRFCLIDNKQLMFMLMDDKDVHPTYDSGVWITTPFFAQMFDSMFSEVWKNLRRA